MLKSQIKKKPVEKKLINLKVTLEQEKEMQKKADKYTGGNLSEWIRYASTQLDAKKSDLVNG